MLSYGSSSQFPFNPDLTDCLLTTLPDFQCLWSFVLSSKFVYSVFRGRQNSIFCAVAHNQFSATLPQAMHVIKCIESDYTVQLEAEPAQDSTVTPAQVRLLQRHAVVVWMLEDIYSWREKDPRSKSSRLSPAESLRFQQSVYRFWLLAAACRPGLGVLGEDNYERHLRLKDSVVAKQTAFLLSLGEAELMGVNEVHKFLLDLARWALVKHNAERTCSPMGFGDRESIHLVWSGPAVVLDVFRGEKFLQNTWQRHDIWRSMSRAFSAAEIASTTVGRARLATRQRFLLDDHFLKTINCSQCLESHSPSRGYSLWSACNWEYMVLAISPARLGSLLTVDQKRPLDALVSFVEAAESIPYSQFIEEIFKMRSERYKNWKKENWFCTHCMMKMLSDSVQVWNDTGVVRDN